MSHIQSGNFIFLAFDNARWVSELCVDACVLCWVAMIRERVVGP